MAERVVLGKNCKLFYNAGTYAEPTWTEVTNVRDVTLTAKPGEADVSHRSGAQFEPTLKAFELTFEQVRVLENAIQTAFLTAFRTDAPIEFAVTEEGTPATASNVWFRSTMKCFDGPTQQPLGDACKIPWLWKPCWSSNLTGWTTNAGA